VAGRVHKVLKWAIAVHIICIVCIKERCCSCHDIKVCYTVNFTSRYRIIHSWLHNKRRSYLSQFTELDHNRA